MMGETLGKPLLPERVGMAPVPRARPGAMVWFGSRARAGLHRSLKPNLSDTACSCQSQAGSQGVSSQAGRATLAAEAP